MRRGLELKPTSCCGEVLKMSSSDSMEHVEESEELPTDSESPDKCADKRIKLFLQSQLLTAAVKVKSRQGRPLWGTRGTFIFFLSLQH